jgi:hypothetical protein
MSPDSYDRDTDPVPYSSVPLPRPVPTPRVPIRNPFTWRRAFISLALFAALSFVALGFVQLLVLQRLAEAAEGTASEIDRLTQSQKVDCSCLEM